MTFCDVQEKIQQPQVFAMNNGITLKIMICVEAATADVKVTTTWLSPGIWGHFSSQIDLLQMTEKN